MTRIAAIGDIHLECLADKLPGDSIGLQLQAIRRVLQRCRDLRITRLIQAGDLFDIARPQEDTVHRFADLILEYPEIKWIVLPGNHDRPLLTQHSLKTLAWLGNRKMMQVEVILKPTLRKVAGLNFWLCPHPFIEDQPRGASLSVGHFAWAGAKRDNGTPHPGTSAPQGRWLLGDFHAAQAGDRYEYIGSLTQVTPFEVLPKGFSIIKTDADGQISIVPQKIKQPYKLSRLEIFKESDLLPLAQAGEHEYFMIYVHPDVTMPPDWQKLYPNIRWRRPMVRETELKKLVERVNLSDNPFDGAEDWLRDRGNLKPEQIVWATNYVTNIAK